MTAPPATFLLNPNVVVKLSGSSCKVFKEGILQREGPEKTLKNWMDVTPPL